MHWVNHGCRRQYIDSFYFKIHDNHKPVFKLHNRDEELELNVSAFNIVKPHNILCVNVDA